MTEDLYISRRWASEIVNEFSRHVLGEGVQTRIGDFRVQHGYHCLNFDLLGAKERFRKAAPAVVGQVFGRGQSLVDELAGAVVRQDSPYIAAIGELSWLVAQGDYAYAAFQITARRKQYILAQPVFTLFKNVDRQTLTMFRIKLGCSFETRMDLDFSSAERLMLAPGEELFVNGFEEAIWFEDSGVVLSMVTTLPLGAYEATFSAETGKFVGLFSTEMRLSSVDVVLRTLAAAGWPGAADVAESVAKHPVRELRWSALNYMWQADLPDLSDRLSTFAEDADEQIAAIAVACRAQLVVTYPDA